MTRCPICRRDAASIFLERSGVPVHQNMVVKEARLALMVPRGDLALCVCDHCGFIFNRAFDPNKLSYEASYDNTQLCSPSARQHYDDLVRRLLDLRHVRGCRIVEVGCGQKGDFIRGLVKADARNQGIGFDPSYAGVSTELDGRLRFVKRFYGPDCAGERADVVVSLHVIEHVPSPMELLKTVCNNLAASPRARVFFETPCVEWILTNYTIWDLFYEHCSYFSRTSMTAAFELAGFRVEQIEHVFGRQYLWLEAALSDAPSAAKVTHGGIPNLARQFALREQETFRRLREWAGARTEKLAVWGAGAKGVTLVNLIDPARELFACVVDLNPNKQGNFVPGTAHPIVGYRELPRYGVKTAVLMNPNYRSETEALLREAGLDIQLVDAGAI